MVGRRECPGHILGSRPLHLPRTPRTPRRFSWLTRWRPGWSPGTTASLPSGRGAGSGCSRRGPGAGPALPFVRSGPPSAPAGPRSPNPPPHKRASPWASQRLPERRASAGRPASRDATHRRRHRAHVPCRVSKLVRARARSASVPAVPEVQGNRVKDD